MPTTDDVVWFKQRFQSQIDAAITGSPFNADFIVALACQETGEVWSRLRVVPHLSHARLLELCVGDSLDAPKRRAFPQNKAALLAAPRGDAMFQLAHQALVNMAAYVPGYRGAAAKATKFCRGFGVFQYDLQFFLDDPAYFLDKKYADFDQCLARCVRELKSAVKKLAWQQRDALSNFEQAAVAIVYNTGRFVAQKALKQGYFDGERYYGECIFDFIRLAERVGSRTASVTLVPSIAGVAVVAAPTPLADPRPTHVVDVKSTLLRVRGAPAIDTNRPTSNVIAHLPDAHPVRAISTTPRNGFLEIETNLSGAYVRGFSSAKYLRAVVDAPVIAVTLPAVVPPADGVTVVSMPRSAGTTTTRREPAGAHSLNEAKQPGRSGTTPAALCADLAAIISWLAVDKASHLRYLPQRGRTFCNIYAHDYCHLAGVYLPRVWWTPGAIEKLAQGQVVPPNYGASIEEMRANMLFRWLRDFGPRFGWRQTGTLTKLQQETNQGAVGLIIARRRDEGRPGHVALVVPETAAERAQRDRAGEVVDPLQSQAGSRNFRYGRLRRNWWNGNQFAEAGYWLHA